MQTDSDELELHDAGPGIECATGGKYKLIKDTFERGTHAHINSSLTVCLLLQVNLTLTHVLRVTCSRNRDGWLGYLLDTLFNLILF